MINNPQRSSAAKLEQLLLEVENLLKTAPAEPSNPHIQITTLDLEWVGAASAGLSEGALRVAVHRLRARYRRELEAELPLQSSLKNR